MAEEHQVLPLNEKTLFLVFLSSRNHSELDRIVLMILSRIRSIKGVLHFIQRCLLWHFLRVVTIWQRAITLDRLLFLGNLPYYLHVSAFCETVDTCL